MCGSLVMEPAATVAHFKRIDFEHTLCCTRRLLDNGTAGIPSSDRPSPQARQGIVHSQYWLLPGVTNSFLPLFLSFFHSFINSFTQLHSFGERILRSSGCDVACQDACEHHNYGTVKDAVKQPAHHWLRSSGFLSLFHYKSL